MMTNLKYAKCELCGRNIGFVAPLDAARSEERCMCCWIRPEGFDGKEEV
jgi:hypothetical protein